MKRTTADLKCYRVWFRDNTAMLVDAFDEQDAKGRAEELSTGPFLSHKVKRVECLSTERN